MYKNILLGFKENIESLDGFVEHVEPTLKDSLGEEKIEKMQEKAKIAKAIVGEIKMAIENNQDPGSVNGKNIKLDNGKQIQIKAEEFNQYVDEVLEFRNKLKFRRNNYEILYKSVLMSLIIYLESMVADIIKQSCIEHPERLGEKTLTLKQIKESGSIDEAISKIVEKEVESLMFKGFDD